MFMLCVKNEVAQYVQALLHKVYAVLVEWQYTACVLILLPVWPITAAVHMCLLLCLANQSDQAP